MCCSLFKISLSLLLAASLMIPNSWCCQALEQQDLHAAVPHGPEHLHHTSQDQKPVSTGGSHSHCDETLYSATGKARVSVSSAPFVGSETIAASTHSAQELILAGLDAPSSARPLHLMNCVWLC
ncbi:hypothetical protein [Gimesia panareensis]|uniref:hypothetical protein n=1 Tax=Gimesia panareensis TaxID=2527978 RepID=UPI001188FAB4|nr:hypothetical protein [Gimesia panareensis]QDU49364.1 hypothetical protein Pan110_16840 [Gimesia panareensis]